jgi:hypothetical protein
MAASADSQISLAPLEAVPEISDYARLAPCSIPIKSGAVRAFTGFMRPFSDDQTAREVLRAIEARIPLQISSGRITAEASHLQKCAFEDFLVETAVPFTILVLEFDGTEHPRAFLTNPRMEPRFSMSPHIRPDKSVWIDGRLQPALCIYSGSLFEYRNDSDRLEQFLDQAATYLAKYMIWLRTRQLFRHAVVGTRQFVYKRKPREDVSEIDTLLSRDIYWDGYWPGPCAPSGPAEHLATIKRGDQCWCWSGKLYGECCRSLDLVRNKNARLRAS